MLKTPNLRTSYSEHPQFEGQTGSDNLYSLLEKADLVTVERKGSKEIVEPKEVERKYSGEWEVEAYLAGAGLMEIILPTTLFENDIRLEAESRGEEYSLSAYFRDSSENEVERFEDVVNALEQ